MPMLYPMQEGTDQREGFEVFESNASDEWVVELLADVTCLLGPFDARTAWETAEAIDATGANVAMLLRPVYELPSPDHLARLVSDIRANGGGLEPTPEPEAIDFLLEKREELASS
jgi:hypothetical protein